VEVKVKTIAIYETEDGQRPFKKWLDSLRDKATIARINARLARVEFGNLGDAKPVGNGVAELRLVLEAATEFIMALMVINSLSF
jgi:putative component of toxin-antitoxin plasmid stabilization module